MPKIDKILTLEITVEQFLNSCSYLELQEVSLLIESALKRKEQSKTITFENNEWVERITEG